MTDPTDRPDLKRLWETLWADAASGDTLRRDFLHFAAGTDVKEVMDWFKLAHAELDRGVENVVEITVPGGILRPRRRRYAAREVVVNGDAVMTDGVERPELRGKDILRVAWVSGKGTVRSYGRTRLRGDINGVLMDTRSAPAPDEADTAGPRP